MVTQVSAEGEEMTVVKKVSFDAAHYLPGYLGKCANMHGHHWVIELGVWGQVGKDGMVIDFSILKEFLDVIKDRLDHHLVNDIVENPTAENICLYIRDEYDMREWPKGVELDFVKVWETEDSYAEVEG